MFLKKLVSFELPSSSETYYERKKSLYISELPYDLKDLDDADLEKKFSEDHANRFFANYVRSSRHTVFRLEFLSGESLLDGEVKKAEQFLNLHNLMFGDTQKFNIEILDPSKSKQKTIATEFAGVRMVMNFDLVSFKNLVTLEPTKVLNNDLSIIVRIQNSKMQIIENNFSQYISDKKTSFSHDLKSNSSFDWNSKIAITVKITNKDAKLPELFEATGFKKREQ